MKKIMVLFCLAVLCLAVLTGCGCEHTWSDAACDAPKTCGECGATEGTTPAHQWLSATCESPKTCRECGAIEGMPAGHNWRSATCESPATCKVCSKTKGTIGEHTWLKANCCEPKRCSTCNVTSGDIGDHVYTKKITTDAYLCSAATVESPAKYYYACQFCNQKSKKTFTNGQQLASAWIKDFYVDQFDDDTDKWFLCNRYEIIGTFSNSATTDSRLMAEVLYDCDGDITIFLYEYGNLEYMVENSSYYFTKDYQVTVRDEKGTTIYAEGTMYSGGCRIFIDDADKKSVLKMMKSAKTMRFFIQSEDAPVSTYRFDLDLTGFAQMLKIVQK